MALQAADCCVSSATSSPSISQGYAEVSRFTAIGNEYGNTILAEKSAKMQPRLLDMYFSML